MNMIHAVLGCLLLAIVAGCGPQADNPADIRAIEHAAVAWDTAWNAGNADALTALYLPDAVAMAPNEPTAFGREAIVSGAKRYFDRFRETNRSHTDDVRISGNLAVARGTQETWSYPKAAGDSTYDRAKWIVAYQRQRDGSWKILWEIYASELPLAAAPAAPPEGEARRTHRR